MTAANEASGRAAREESIALRRKAIAVFEGALDPHDPVQAAALAHQLVALARAVRLGFDHKETFALLDRAQHLVTPHDLAEDLALIHVNHALAYSRFDAARCRASAELALVEAKRAGSVLAELRALSSLADAHLTSGDIEGMIEPASRSIQLAEEHDLGEVIGEIGSGLAIVHYFLLQLDDARRVSDLAIRFAPQTPTSAACSPRCVG